MNKVVVIKKKETLKIAQRFMEVLPMLIPLEKVKWSVVDIWMDEQDEVGKPAKKQWGVFCRCERRWADGLIIYEIMLPLNLLRRIVIPGRFSRRVLLALIDMARERETLEPEFTKEELLKAMDFTEERLRKGGKIYELVECVLSAWGRMHIEIRMGKGKYWKKFKRWEGGPIDSWGWKGEKEGGKGAKLYVRFSKELFEDLQFLRIPIDRLNEVLSRDETYFLDFIDDMQGFPSIPFGLYRLFTERLGYTKEKLIHIGNQEIKKRFQRMVNTVKEEGRLRKPYPEKDEYTKRSGNALEWVVELNLSVNKVKELGKEIFEWMEKSSGYDPMKKHQLRVKVIRAIKKEGVKWVRKMFEHYEREGKHPKDFWKEVDEGRNDRDKEIAEIEGENLN